MPSRLDAAITEDLHTANTKLIFISFFLFITLSADFNLMDVFFIISLLRFTFELFFKFSLTSTVHYTIIFLQISQDRK